MKPKQLTPQHLAWLCEQWNRLYPIGTWVEYHPILGESAHRLRRTSSEASILSDHTAIIFLDGETGCVALEACTPVKGKS
jgi:hypothetical protein